MQHVKTGDVVKVHYTGKLTNGEQFDSSTGRAPLEFTVGAGQMIKGFDKAMPGMAVGEKKTVNISPDDAYGQKNEDARQGHRSRGAARGAARQGSRADGRPSGRETTARQRRYSGHRA